LPQNWQHVPISAKLYFARHLYQYYLNVKFSMGFKKNSFLFSNVPVVVVRLDALPLGA